MAREKFSVAVIKCACLLSSGMTDVMSIVYKHVDVVYI